MGGTPVHAVKLHKNALLDGRCCPAHAPGPDSLWASISRVILGSGIDSGAGIAMTQALCCGGPRLLALGGMANVWHGSGSGVGMVLALSTRQMEVTRR